MADFIECFSLCRENVENIHYRPWGEGEIASKQRKDIHEDLGNWQIQ